MKLIKNISTAGLVLLLGTAVSVYAQKGHGGGGGGGGGGQKGQQAQRGGGGGGQHQQQAHSSRQSQRTRVAQRSRQPQRTQQARSSRQRTQRASYNHGNNGFHGNGNNGHHYGQISDVSYRAHFGHDHSFRMMRPQMIDGFNRFQYSGYWFGYNQPWPSDWDRNDHVYVQYVDSSYYLYDLSHRGIHLSLNIF